MESMFSQLAARAGEIITYCWQWLTDNPSTVGQWYSGALRWFMPVLALMILLSVLRSMLRVKNPVEVWGYLRVDERVSFPIIHWECTIGRAKHCDTVINLPTVSRTQCSLIRDDNGLWTVHGLSDGTPTSVNGQEITGPTPLSAGDVLSFGDVKLSFEPLTADGLEEVKRERRQASAPTPPWHSLLLLTLFQVLTAVALMLARADHARTIGLCFAVLAIVMWCYTLFSRVWRRKGFEIETLAFFACTMGLAVTASSVPGALLKQTIAMLIGICGFLALGWYLRDLRRAVKIRYPMAIGTVLLLSLSLVFGAVTNGAQNWISIAGISMQPSEIAKISFIFAGSATLDRLFSKHNLWGFIIFSVACMGLLALMSDFGAAAIIFVVFLVIAYLRSGDFATISLICAGAAAAGGLMLRFKPYIAERFATWGHVWEFANSGGYQQTRAMSAAASGGLIGVGAGNGWLRLVAAGDTDLVFAMVCEEWGLVISLLLVACILTLAVFAVRLARRGRSAFYSTAAIAAASLLVFQTTLNVLGSVDILPLTGVTFPFVSVGGSSMVAAWGLLAFIKAADTRQDASFAVKRSAVTEDMYEPEAEAGPAPSMPADAPPEEPDGDAISRAFAKDPDLEIFFLARDGGKDGPEAGRQSKEADDK